MGVLKCESYVQSCDFSRDGDHVITGEFKGDVKVRTLHNPNVIMYRELYK